MSDHITSSERWLVSTGTVLLRCPKCRRRKTVSRHNSDPPGTAIVESLCLECTRWEDGGEVTYWDKEGKQILPYQSAR